MNIGEVLNGVFDEYVGWRPASGSIKPVHVANGLARALTGEAYDTSGVVEFIIPWKAGRVPDPKRNLPEILKGQLGGPLRDLAQDPKQFERARRFLYGAFVADRGVFPDPEQSTITLTCRQMISRSPNDRNIGQFAAALLSGVKGADDLARALRSALSDDGQRDPLTLAAWPLLSPDDPRTVPDERTKRVREVLRQPHNQPWVGEIQKAAACLATHEAAQGNRLRKLQRAVQFVCVAIHAHAQSLAASGDLDRRPPALLVASPADEIATASERSVDLIYDGFERWLVEALARRLGAGEEAFFASSSLPERQPAAEKLLRAVGQAKKEKGSKEHPPPDDEALQERLNAWLAARDDHPKSPEHWLAAALVSSYLQEYESGGPRPFLQSLARRVGLLYPHFQGRSREKRFRPAASVLDMLVRACVESGRSVPLDEFLERLWRRFGFIVGGRQSEAWNDGAVLHERGVAVDATALVENSAALVRQLHGMGLARLYADNVTFVGEVHAG